MRSTPVEGPTLPSPNPGGFDSVFPELSLLTQNATQQRGTIVNLKLTGGPSRIRTYDQAIMRSLVYRPMRILTPITSKK